MRETSLGALLLLRAVAYDYSATGVNRLAESDYDFE